MCYVRTSSGTVFHLSQTNPNDCSTITSILTPRKHSGLLRRPLCCTESTTRCRICKTVMDAVGSSSSVWTQRRVGPSSRSKAGTVRRGQRVQNDTCFRVKRVWKVRSSEKDAKTATPIWSERMTGWRRCRDLNADWPSKDHVITFSFCPRHRIV